MFHWELSQLVARSLLHFYFRKKKKICQAANSAMLQMAHKCLSDTSVAGA